MATRGELTSYVLERLGVSSNRTTFSEQVKGQLFREYVRAVREFELKKDVALLALSADDPFVDVPDDFLKALTLRIGTVVLRETTDRELAQAQASRTGALAADSGLDTFTFMDPDRFYLDPAPTADADQGATLFYVVRPPAWDDDSDSPDWLPEDYHDYLAELVVSRLALNQEEFATHSVAAQANADRLRASLLDEMDLRRGRRSQHVRRRHYG